MFMLNDYSCIYFMPGEKRNIFVDMDGCLPHGIRMPR